MTFLDMKNAFGSADPGYANYTANHLKRSPLHRKPLLQAVCIREDKGVVHWQVHNRRAFFQGDILSPLIVFNPIIQLAQSLHTCEFCQTLPSTLPEVAKPTPTSMLSGTYQTPMNPWGSTWPKSLPLGLMDQFTSSTARETYWSPMELKWQPAHRTDKWFRPTSDITGTSSSCHSNPQRICQWPYNHFIIRHVEVLQTISDSLRWSRSHAKPSKYISLVLDGKRRSDQRHFRLVLEPPETYHAV